MVVGLAGRRDHVPDLIGELLRRHRRRQQRRKVLDVRVDAVGGEDQAVPGLQRYLEVVGDDARHEGPVEQAAAAKAEKAPETKAEKAAAKAQEKKDHAAKDAKAPEATPATPEPVKTEKVLTETWSYQLPADE